jgi:RHS repeat-associated protein
VPFARQVPGAPGVACEIHYGNAFAHSFCKNPSGRHVHDFRWDADGRLREVREGASSRFSATYTADGERYQNSDVGGSHLYSFGLYDDANGGAYTYTPGLAVRRNGVDRFFHSDWLGSTRALTDGSGGLDPNTGGASVPYRKRFDAYGLQSNFAGTDSPDAVVQQYAGAWGYQRDAAELGLDYLYQRYYDPALGRFITRDPIRWAGGLNLYGYVNNDPVGAADPLGLWPEPNERGKAFGRTLTNAASWLLRFPGEVGKATVRALSPLWRVKLSGSTKRLGDANPESPSGFALRRRSSEISDGID